VTGASAVPCTDTYGGLFPYSEPESKALNDFYATLHQNVKIYLSFHSAAQSLLYPWGHIGTYENMPNKDHLVRGLKKNIKNHNRKLSHFF
jgi:Zinc carboxypeptidase